MISEFKAKAISALKQVRSSRIPMEITLRGQPLARIVPPEEPGEQVVRFDAGAELVVDTMTLEDWEEESLEDDWDSFS